MKKILAILLAMLMIFSLVACGGAADDDDDDDDWDDEEITTEAASYPDSGKNHKAPDSVAGDLVFTFFGNNKVEDGKYWGDCSLMKMPDESYVLVDACEGGYENDIVNTLKDQGISHIETAIISHYHSDHYGGLDTFVKEFGIKNIYIDGFELDDTIAWNTNSEPLKGFIKKYEQKGLTVKTLMAGDSFEIAGVKFDILYPRQDTAGATTNDTSNVMRVEWGGLVALYTGDLYYTGEAACLAEVDDVNMLKADLLKIMHHGANTSGSEEFIAAVSAKVAVAMGGHHLPNLTLGRYKKVGTEVCEVWSTGDTHVQFHAGSDAPYLWTDR